MLQFIKWRNLLQDFYFYFVFVFNTNCEFFKNIFKWYHKILRTKQLYYLSHFYNYKLVSSLNITKSVFKTYTLANKNQESIRFSLLKILECRRHVTLDISIIFLGYKIVEIRLKYLLIKIYWSFFFYWNVHLTSESFF
jgi:hypothetical protein